MPKKGPHLDGATRAAGPTDRGLLRLGRAIRHMREDRGWSQAELVRRIMLAEGQDADHVKGVTNNMRVSRAETGYPITMRNLTGFALAFGYRTAIDWLADVFAQDALTPPAPVLSADEQGLLADYRAADPTMRPLVRLLAKESSKRAGLGRAERSSAQAAHPGRPRGRRH
jgi:transcriptional regulator with XRE-family HTH domain